MVNTKEPNEVDPYLKSPESFYLEMPLYHPFDLSGEDVAKKIYGLLNYDETIDGYCVWCEKEAVFSNYKNFRDYTTVPSWVSRNDGLIEIIYRCARDYSHTYHIYFFKDGDKFTKVGQYPSVAEFQIPQAKKYRSVLGEEQYKDLTRGIGLAAHGVGIGSFVYLRRVFEHLIEEAHQKAKKEDEKFDEGKFTQARMDEKIKMVSSHLPDFLVENRKLYSILSRGIHELSEKECLLYYETVKIGIEQILDEKIVNAEKIEKANKARAAIEQVHKKLAN